jgi:hypothetical protein
MKNQGKRLHSNQTSEFLTMVGIVGIISCWIFAIVVELITKLYNQ